METSTTKVDARAEETRKEYIKPEVKKHKSMAVVSGSDCTYILDSEYNYI